MREVATELGISKDLVKYHRKKLGEEDYLIVDGKYMILESGVAKIKSYLRKEASAYSTQFEDKITTKLSKMEYDLFRLYQTLGELEKKLKSIDQGVSDLFDVVIDKGI
ncbi:hypothetical protein [Streptococcus suis]